MHEIKNIRIVRLEYQGAHHAALRGCAWVAGIVIIIGGIGYALVKIIELNNSGNLFPV